MIIKKWFTNIAMKLSLDGLASKAGGKMKGSFGKGYDEAYRSIEIGV